MPKEDRSSWVAVGPDQSTATSSTASSTAMMSAYNDGIPPPVPNPISAYQYFQRECTQRIRQELTEANGAPPDLPTVSRAVSDRWKQIDETDERERFESLAREDRFRYARDSHHRDIEMEKRREAKRKERECGILEDGAKRQRKTILPPTHGSSSTTTTHRKRKEKKKHKKKLKTVAARKKKKTKGTDEDDDGEDPDDSDFSEGGVKHDDDDGGDGPSGDSEEESAASSDDDDSSASSDESSINSNDSDASYKRREREKKQRAKERTKERRLAAKAKRQVAATEKKKKETYITNRQEELRKERADQAKKRLEFLLKQSDIFSHFGNVKEDRAKFRGGLRSTSGGGHAAGGAEVETDEAAGATTSAGAEVAGKCIRIHRHGSDVPDTTNTTSEATTGTETSSAGRTIAAGQENQEEEELDPEATASATYLTSQPSAITHGKLRPYQLEGLNWMIRLQENGVNGILADEMGLGKTLQSISVLVYQKQFGDCNGPHLVVVPKSTLSNWMNELKRWAPTLTAIRFHGSKEEREEMICTRLQPATTDDAAREWEVCVTTYEVCNTDRQILNKFAWNYLIIDEAHRLKNETSVFSKVVRTFETKYRLLLTGTPLQNNLHELWALLNFLVPDVFANSEQFDEWFNLDIEDDEKKNNLIGQLHKILRPFMLRRLKVDVEGSLPPKRETILFVGMSVVQKKLYKDLLMRDIEMLQGGGSQTAILNIVMQLRKCAGHPYLFPFVEDRTLPPLGEHLVTNCGKMVLLDKLLKRLYENGNRVLLFTQMTRILDILEDYLVMRRYKYCRIDGNTSYDVREESIDAYNKPGSEKFLFLLSTRAGGLGINLQTADTVILYDSDWNPQADLQAQDRAHRIGQKREVNVYRLVTEHTIEEKIVERAQQKLKLDAMVVQQGRLKEKDKMSRDELLQAIRFGADKVFKSKDSSITDDDIDLILNIGQKRTAELNEKLQNADKGDMLDFKLDGGITSAQTYEGVDYSKNHGQSDDAQAQLFGIIDLGKRERRQVTNYNESKLYQQMEQNAGGFGAGGPPKRKKETKLPKCLRLPRLEEWQMFDRDALYALQEEEEVAFRALPDEQRKLVAGIPVPPPSTVTTTGVEGLGSPSPSSSATAPADASEGGGSEQVDNISPATPASGTVQIPTLLSEEKLAQKGKLLAEGFWDWHRHHYSAFIKASARFGRTEYAKIAEEVGKPQSAIEEYCKAFFDESFGKRRISEHEYDRVLKTIERGEKKMGEMRNLERATERLIYLFDNPWVELEICHTQFKDKAFTMEEDRHLLCWSYKFGYGQWEAVKMAIRRSPTFRFDYFLRSLPTEAIGRRCEQLMRAAEREIDQLEKIAREEAGIDCSSENSKELPPVELPMYKEMLARKREKAEAEREAEQTELEAKVEEIENQMEEIQKRLKVLDDYSKDGNNFSASKRGSSMAMEVPDELIPELVNLVARSGPDSKESVAAEFTSLHPGQCSKKQTMVKIDEVAKKEKRTDEGETKVMWHIRSEYESMLDVSTLRYLRKEKKKRMEAKRGGRKKKGGARAQSDLGGTGKHVDYGIPTDFPEYDGSEPPRENKKAFTHFCIHTRKEVKSSLDSAERKDKNKIHSILKKRWYELTDEDKVIWREWEKWDAKRYAHDMDIFDSRGKTPSSKKESPADTAMPQASVERRSSNEASQEPSSAGGIHIPKKKRFKHA